MTLLPQVICLPLFCGIINEDRLRIQETRLSSSFIVDNSQDFSQHTQFLNLKIFFSAYRKNNFKIQSSMRGRNISFWLQLWSYCMPTCEHLSICPSLGMCTDVSLPSQGSSARQSHSSGRDQRGKTDCFGELHFGGSHRYSQVTVLAFYDLGSSLKFDWVKGKGIQNFSHFTFSNI